MDRQFAGGRPREPCCGPEITGGIAYTRAVASRDEMARSARGALFVAALSALAVGAGCREPPAPSASVATTTTSPAPMPDRAESERAFVADASGLVEVGASGVVRVISAGAVDACLADARANVVWFVRDDAVFAFDLVDQKPHLVVEDTVWTACAARSPTRRTCADPAVESLFANAQLIIDYGAERLGGEDPVGYFVGVAVKMGAAPKVAAALGCDGDAATYCYDFASGGGKTPKPEIAARVKAIDALRIADPAYVAGLAARGASRSLWTPLPPAGSAPKSVPPVDPKACEEIPDDCGKLQAIPWSPLWLVTTGNSRGDYFHETRALWDPSASAFVRVDGPRLVHEVKPTPPRQGAAGFAGMRVSPRGLLSRAGFVFDASKVHFAPAGDGLTCGFSDGGVRLGGHDD